jgi:hypothetical protein
MGRPIGNSCIIIINFHKIYEHLNKSWRTSPLTPYKFARVQYNLLFTSHIVPFHIVKMEGLVVGTRARVRGFNTMDRDRWT